MSFGDKCTMPVPVIAKYLIIAIPCFNHLFATYNHPYFQRKKVSDLFSRCFAQIEFHSPPAPYCPECDYWREATKTKFTGEKFCLLGNLRNYKVIIKLGGGI